MKKRNITIIVVLLIITAIIAAIYLLGRNYVPKGKVSIVFNEKSVSVDPFKAASVNVNGTTVNGKGKEKEISTTGVTLLSVIQMAGVSDSDFSKALVVSSDEYSAELTSAEILDPDIAFLIKSANDDDTESIKLIVFGDSDSKRQVKNVERIELK
ncbi:MAG: hypothetical protein J6W58_10535 [Lachnospiraceae bacterium]|nr:hypothetical protein [Lachnospiraceae bacterium]MBP5746719.1 hypothetical protein [Lachnospiraceae bacterium]